MQVTVTGEATDVGPGLGALGFAVGDALILTYTFDDALVVDFAPAADFGYFPMPTGSMTVKLSGYTASVTDIGVAIDATFDTFSMGNNGYPMPSDLPAGYQVQGLSFFVLDTNLSNITSDAFQAAPDLSLPWNNTGFTFFVDQPQSAYVRASSPVPAWERCPSPPRSRCSASVRQASSRDGVRSADRRPTVRRELALSRPSTAGTPSSVHGGAPSG